MKKSIKKLMLILGVASAVAGLTACGNTQQGEHSTDYSSYVSNGSLGHSGVYADGSIDYKYSYAHVWGNDECSLCGQKSTGKEEEKPTPPPVTPVQKDVGKIEIEANPTKMKYWIGETFSPEGGSVKITYKDGTTEVKPMTDEIFTHNDVKTNSVGRKTVTITLGGQKASFTIKDANKNWESTYELDYGDYALYVSSDAHTKKFTIPFSIEKDIIIGSDPVTGSSVENRYTDVGLDSSDYHLQTLLTRNGWDMPTSPTNEERTIDADFLAALKDTAHNNPNVDSYYEMDKPTFGNTDIPLVLRDLLTYNEDGSFAVDEKGNYVAYDDARWDMLINKLSLSDLKNMCNLGAFKTNALPSIEKPLTNDTDGPTGFTNFMDQTGTYWDTCYYCAEVVMSSTWDAELIEELGATVGEEGFVGSDGKGNNLPYSGWYAPGVNTHRSPFGGRNFEYFSEDGILSGKIAAAEIRGCRSRGVYCFVKHFALNEQETHRSSNGSSTWVTEQAMREIYLKPFELAVKDGGTTAIMSSFNRIGTRWTGGDYRLLTQILRDEWGFNGTVITDFNTTSYMNLKQMAYAGGDLNLGNDMTLIPSLTPDWCKSDDTADLIVLRNNVKNILYTVVNSNAVNGIVDHYIMAWWKILIIVLDCAVVVGAGVWGYFAVRNFLKKEDEA